MILAHVISNGDDVRVELMKHVVCELAVVESAVINLRPEEPARHSEGMNTTNARPPYTRQLI